MPKQCGECRYLITNDIQDGQCYCKEKRERRFADDYYADTCDGFFRLGWGYTSEGKKAIREAEEYKKNKKPECFITTAVVDILGFDDNCHILETLRKFRKEVLQPNPEYKSILLQYDLIGPRIAHSLRNDPDAYSTASDIYFSYLTKCVEAIEEEHKVEAINIYKDMTNFLTEKYLPNEILTVSPEIEKQYNQNLGGHGRLALN